jgi:hypothetical protein
LQEGAAGRSIISFTDDDVRHFAARVPNCQAAASTPVIGNSVKGKTMSFTKFMEKGQPGWIEWICELAESTQGFTVNRSKMLVRHDRTGTYMNLEVFKEYVDSGQAAVDENHCLSTQTKDCMVSMDSNVSLVACNEDYQEWMMYNKMRGGNHDWTEFQERKQGYEVDLATNRKSRPSPTKGRKKRRSKEKRPKKKIKLEEIKMREANYLDPQSDDEVLVVALRKPIVVYSSNIDFEQGKTHQSLENDRQCKVIADVISKLEKGKPFRTLFGK